MKFLDFWVVGWKFTKFLMSFLEPRVSFSFNFASLFSARKHNSSVFFHLNFICFGQKDLIKVQIFRLSTAYMKINQIPCVIFQATCQFSFEICINIQCHDTIPLKFSNWKIIFFGQKEPINVQFFKLLSALMKVYPIPWMPFLKPLGRRVYSIFASLFSVMKDNSSIFF